MTRGPEAVLMRYMDPMSLAVADGGARTFTGRRARRHARVFLFISDPLRLDSGVQPSVPPPTYTRLEYGVVGGGAAGRQAERVLRQLVSGCAQCDTNPIGDAHKQSLGCAGEKVYKKSWSVVGIYDLIRRRCYVGGCREGDRKPTGRDVPARSRATPGTSGPRARAPRLARAPKSRTCKHNLPPKRARLKADLSRGRACRLRCVRLRACSRCYTDRRRARSRARFESKQANKQTKTRAPPRPRTAPPIYTSIASVLGSRSSLRLRRASLSTSTSGASNLV